jgi:FlaG/FlaF family flagellin (archaellin)
MNIGRSKGRQPAIGNAKPVTMVGVKGNNGKASGAKTFTEVLVLVAITIVVVASIKTFATSSPWHSKATIEEHQGQPAKLKATSVDISISSAIEAGKDATDKNLIQFVFGNLDGVKGNDGAYISMI